MTFSVKLHNTKMYITSFVQNANHNTISSHAHISIVDVLPHESQCLGGRGRDSYKNIFIVGRTLWLAVRKVLKVKKIQLNYNFK